MLTIERRKLFVLANIILPGDTVPLKHGRPITLNMLHTPRKENHLLIHAAFK